MRAGCSGRACAAKTSASASSRSASVRAASLYWGIANGVSGRFGFFSGLVAIQASTAGLNSLRNRLK